jgi:trimeric autotransporter adhesin
VGNRSNISLVGNTTQGTNLGGGAGIFIGKNGENNLQFRTIAVTGSLSIITGATTLTISGATGGASYTFCNGLTKNINNSVVLGGALTGNTALTGAFTLSVCGGAKLNTTCGYQISGSTILKTPKTLESIFVGNNAGNITATGIYNFGALCNALAANTSGTNNVAIGFSALFDNTVGINNVAIGQNALCGAGNGNCNIAIGFAPLHNSTSGYQNIAVGSAALFCNSTGFNNIAIGQCAVNGNPVSVTGNNNIGIGKETLWNISNGNCNIAMGWDAEYSVTTGSSNIALGYRALFSNSTGNRNIGIGLCAGSAETGSDKLYIANSNTTHPLIYGDFSAKCAIIYGAFKTSGATSLLVAPSNGTCSDSVLVIDGSGIIKKVPYVSGATGGGITGATNGLSVSGKNIVLGGTLTCNTTILMPNKILAFSGNSAASDSICMHNGYYCTSYVQNSSGITEIASNGSAKSCLVLSANTAILKGGGCVCIDGSAGTTNIIGCSSCVKIDSGGICLNSQYEYIVQAPNTGSTSDMILVRNSCYGEIRMLAVSAITSGGTGGLSWNGSCVNGIGTYVDSTHICSQPNLTFDGTTLSVTGITYASIRMCSPIICGTSCVKSPQISGITAVCGAKVSATNCYQLCGRDILRYGILDGSHTNLLIGRQVGGSCPYGGFGTGNIGVGECALNGVGNTFGNAGDNIAIGYKSLYSLDDGFNNIAIGTNALYKLTNGCDNVALGCNVLSANTTGSGNFGTGCNALLKNTYGINNIAIGCTALCSNSTGSENIAIGSFAMIDNTTGCYNIAYGFNTLGANTIGNCNVAIGYYAMVQNVRGNCNIALGNSVMNCNTCGNCNIAIGFQALGKNVSGNTNIAVGSQALSCNQTGCYNVGVGVNTLSCNSTGCYNVAIGYYAGQGSTGNSKLYIGSGKTTLIYGEFDNKRLVISGTTEIVNNAGCNYLYLGNKDTDGSWRFVVSGSSPTCLVVQTRASGVWGGDKQIAP